MSCHDWKLLKTERVPLSDQRGVDPAEEAKARRKLGAPEDPRDRKRWACLWECKECGLKVETRSVVTDTLVTPLPSADDVERALREAVDAVHGL